MSEERTDWERLLQKCEQAGLPVPVMSPMGLRSYVDKIAISIGDTQFSGDSMSEAISRARIYVQGYGDHVELLQSQRAGATHEPFDPIYRNFLEWRKWALEKS